MTDHADLYDEGFFSDQERPQTPREQVTLLINRYCSSTGKSHSLAWRKAYLGLEDRTGFRVPDKKILDAIQKAGLMPTLLEVVNGLLSPGVDHASEVNSRIPDYVPYESDRSRWFSRKPESEATSGVLDNGSPDSVASRLTPTERPAECTGTCPHQWGVFSTVLADVCLLVQCVECGAYGRVNDPSADEWHRAFHAPSEPYRWPHGERVELLPGSQEDESLRHIRRKNQKD